MTKTEAVVNDIVKKIGTGQYEPGQRLPFIREIREHYGISYYTWWQAKQILAKRGLIDVGRAGDNNFPVISTNAPYFL